MFPTISAEPEVNKGNYWNIGQGLCFLVASAGLTDSTLLPAAVCRVEDRCKQDWRR